MCKWEGVFMGRRILVTGAGGFIGRYVVDSLLGKGYEVVALIHKKRPCFSLPSGEDSRISTIETDICQESMVEQTARQAGKCDVVVHLAADLGRNGGSQTIQTNCLGTFHAIRLAEEIAASQFLYMSSIPVIGVPKYFPVTEKHPVNPNTLYHITKYAGEQMVCRICPNEIKKTILRIPSPIGVGMSEHSFLSFLLKSCREQETIELFGEGKRIQNYIDVRDIARAVLRSILLGKEGLFLIAGKEGVTNHALAVLCKELTKSSSEIVWGMREDPEEGNQWLISGEKAEEFLGFCPKYRLEESIEWMNSSFGKMEVFSREGILKRGNQ